MRIDLLTPAASVAAQPPMGATADCPHYAGDGSAPAKPSPIGAGTLLCLDGPTGEAGAPNLSNFSMPSWARSDEARALLAGIIAEQPPRSRVVADTMTGPAALGYAGKTANRLRQLFDEVMMHLIDWCQRPGFGTDEYHRRRAAVLRYADRHGPDALIERALKAVA